MLKGIFRKRTLVQYVEKGKILKWWMPDRFIFVNKIPRTSVGKFDKKVMGSSYGNVLEGEG
jgi:fatty-acyl-CoA synthase